MLLLCSPCRKQRSDKVDLAVADESCQYNTNTNKDYLVFNPNTNKHERHRQRIQIDSLKSIYRSFKHSQEYLNHVVSNQGHTIGFRRFQGAKCPCIKHNRLRKCADTSLVAFWYLFKALQHIIKKEHKAFRHCKCAKHVNDVDNEMLIKAILAGESAFLAHLLCEDVTYDELSRSSENLFTEEKREQLTKENIAFVDIKAAKLEGKRCGWDVRRNVQLKSKVSTRRAVESPTIKSFQQPCCHGECNNCGVVENLKPGKCPIEGRINDSTVKYRKYVSTVATPTDESGGSSAGKKKQKIYVNELQEVTVI